MEKAAKARVRCALVKFKEVSSIQSMCPDLTYGTETWRVKVENLHR